MIAPRSPLALSLGWLVASLGCSDVAEVLTARSTGGTSSQEPGAGGATGGSGGGASAAGASAAAAGATNPEPQPELGISLSAGQTHACVAKAGLVYCWGDNRDGELGAGDTAEHAAPVLVRGSGNVAQVSVGERHSCWLDADGVVSCFGSNLQGQLGQGAMLASAPSPVVVTLPGKATRVDVGYLHSCAILESGELYCWGENVETQLGQGDEPDENQSTPVRVADFTDIVAVSCGQGHTLALRESGEVYGWGRNTAGQIGQGEGAPNRIRTPTRIGGASGVSALDAGQDSACALVAGEPYCWGSGIEQHLGNYSESTVLEPLAIAGLPPLKAISLDTFHTCAIDERASLWCFGRAIEGQLGLGDNRSVEPEPQQIATPSEGQTWLTVGTGRFFTCAVTSDERVWCTGSNSAHELGTTDTERRNAFNEVPVP